MKKDNSSQSNSKSEDTPEPQVFSRVNQYVEPPQDTSLDTIIKRVLVRVQRGALSVPEGQQALTKRLVQQRAKLFEQITREEFSKLASEVQDEYEMGGLADGLYEDFAWDIFKKALNRLEK